MFIASSPRWKRLHWAVTFCLALLSPLTARAGNTHSEGGAVTEAPGVPETDATATVQIYWTGDSAARTSVVTGATLSGYWLHDVGFALARQWLVGDTHIAVLERETGAGTAAHVGYYGLATKALTSLDPDEFPAMTVRPIPVPTATAGPGNVALHWGPAQTAGTPSAVSGYDLYRSTDGIAFTKLNAATLADTTYTDATVVFGTTYRYALGLVYAGTPAYVGTAKSANSAPVTPLDSTPPDAPEMVAEPAFTAGIANVISWTDEAASGATAYYAEIALDAAFTSLVGNSGWIATTNHTFTDLADGQVYYFRTRARDAANNESPFGTTTTSRQDASAPTSNALAMAAFKADPILDVEWTAQDALSGVAGVQLWWSKDGGAFALYPNGPYTATPIAFDASTTGGDGVYAFYTMAADNVANAETPPEAPDATTTIDTQAPAAPVLATLAPFGAGPDRLIGWNASADAAAYRVQAATDASFATIAQASDWVTELEHTFTGLADAQIYHYRVQARDAAGNESVVSAIEASTQDATAPATAVTSMPSASGVTSFPVPWTGSDATSGLAAVRLFYSKDGGPYLEYEGGPFTTSPIAFDAVGTGGDGLYAFFTRGTDAVDNVEDEPAAADAQIAVDTAAPGAPTLASMTTFSPGTQILVNWSDESGSGALQYRAQMSQDPGFGVIDATSDWVSGLQFTFTGLADATTYSFRVQARDIALNETGWSGIKSTTMDAATPASQVDAMPSLGNDPALAIAWTASDATSGVDNVDLYWSKDGGPWQAAAGGPFATSPIAFDASGSGDGSYRFYTIAHDHVGNVETAPASADASTVLDTTSPATQVAALPPTSGAALAIGWSGSDATSGMLNADLYYSKDGGAFELAPNAPFASSPIAFDASALGDGTYAFYTRGRDLAGNLEAAPASADAQTLVDTSAPGVPTLTTLVSFTAGNSVDLQWSAVGGAESYRAQMAPTASFASIGADTGWITGTTFAFTGLQDGDAYYFRVQSRDVAMNESAFSNVETTVVDAAAPVSALAALPALVATATLQLDWSGSDITSGVAGVDLYYSRDGGTFTLYPGSPFATTPIAFASASTGGDGQYAFYIRARDGAGNLEPAPGAPDAQTRIDTTAPNAAVITALPQWSPGTTVLLMWTSQAASGAVEYMAETSPAADFTIPGAQSGWIASTSFIFQPLEDGSTYWFRVKCRDAALNEAVSVVTQSTTLDDTSPASAVSTLAAVTTTLVFPIAWTGNDATSGVASVDLYYARDGGAYTLYAGGPWTSSPISFDAATTGGQGNYAFYTRARDRVFNREAAPGGPDAQTIVNTSAVASPTLAALPAYTAGTDRNVSWTPGANNVAYWCQASTSNTFASIHAESGWISSTAFAFTGLTDGARYYYRVKARNVVAVESAYSTLESSVQDATAPVSQVAALPATQATAAFDIAWSGSDATSGITGVELFVSRNGGAFAAYAGGPFLQSPIAFDAATLGGDGAYAFYTRATDGAGNTEMGPVTPDAQTTIDTSAPTHPTMLAEPTTTPGLTNTVNWNAVPGAADYEAACATDAGFANVIATSGWINATSHTFSGLQDGVTYWYRARARDAAANPSAWSAAVSSTQAAGYVLPSGWNLVSFNVDPADPRIDRVLQSIQGSYGIVRTYDQGAFASYLPSLPIEFNDLQDMDALHGYWIHMTKTDTLVVGGTPTNPSTPIPLRVGWNLAGYLPTQPMSPAVALVSIAGSYALARGYEPGTGYQTYYPSLPALSDLVAMRAGQGYWFYMTADDELVYGGLPKAEDARTPAPLPFAAGADAASVPTVMDVWSTEFTIDGKPAPAGTVLDVFDAAGTRCGSATVKHDGTIGIVHIAGDLSTTEADEGATDGETLVLSIRGQEMTWVGDADLGFKAHDARALALEFVSTESLLPKAFSLAANVPNPFNPTTTLSYAIPSRVEGERLATTRVQLRIFDVRGRAVRTLIDAEQAPGRYSIVWDGRDDRGTSVGTGVYFYRLHTPEFTQARKMLLVK